jgi:DNA-binding LacI/PurR family transcriptional regulator
MASSHAFASQADVARRAGVSAETVSRVSHDSPAVSASTKKKVLRIMKELGYRPNGAAQALKRGSFQTLGVTVFNMRSTGNLLLLRAITESANKMGYSLTLQMVPHDQKTTLTDMYMHMRPQAVDGMIIVLEQAMSDLDTFTPSPLLPVIIVTSLKAPHASTIDSDQEMAGRLAVNRLLELGHRNVWFVSGPSDSIANQYREKGWREALVAHGITPPEIPSLCRGDWSPNSGYQAGCALAHIPDCTAIYAANDAMANGVIAGLETNGKRVPQDVSVIGEDDSLKAFEPNVRLSTIREDWTKVGTQAVRMTVNAVRSRHPQPEHVLLPCELIERETTAPAPASASVS